MRLLLVEENEILGDGLVAGLTTEGYALDWLTNGMPADEPVKRICASNPPQAAGQPH